MEVILVIRLSIEGKLKEIQEDRSLKEIAERYADNMKQIVAALVDNEMKNLDYIIEKDAVINWVYRNSADGYRILSRTITLIFILAAKRVIPEHNIIVEHSIGNGLYLERKDGEALKHEELYLIEQEMEKIIKEDLPIERKSVDRDIAISLFEKEGYADKIRLLKTLKKEEFDIYTVDGRYFSFHGYLAPATKYIEKFRLHSYYPGVVIVIPTPESGGRVPPFKEEKSLAKIFESSKKWTDLLDIGSVGSLNEKILKKDIDFLIHVSEAYFENQVAAIAENIVKDGSISMVQIAGPSSSGKTTLAYRLAVQLGVHGLKPIPLHMDDYFVDREDTPLDEEGKRDFEAFEAIQLDLFNKDLLALIEGEKIELPKFNFITGKSERSGRKIKLEKKSILILEGIHGLNPKLTHLIPEKKKYKVYVSALTQLNMDSHNRISTTDVRLLRRMVRDTRTRGKSLDEVFTEWRGVRKGEKKNIYPYQDYADIAIDSSLVYEIPVLKKYVMKLFDQYDREGIYYKDVKRLKSFLKYFIEFEEEENIPSRSILREFIGKKGEEA